MSQKPYVIDVVGFESYIPEKNCAVVMTTSYDNILPHLASLKKDLVELGFTNGHIIFDSITAQGNNSHRFMEGSFNNGEFVQSSIKQIQIPKGQNEKRKFHADLIRKHKLTKQPSLMSTVQKRIFNMGYAC